MAEPEVTEAQPPASFPRGGWRRPARAVVAAGSWFCLLTVVGLWALLQAGDLWWPATLLMFGPRWLLAVPPALLIPAAAVLRRRSLGPLLLTLVLVLGPVIGFCVPWQRLQPGPPAGMRVRVLAFNLHYHNLDPDALQRLVTENQPDVVALEEWWGATPWVVFGGDGWHTDRARGLFMASRYPIRKAEHLGLDTKDEVGSIKRYELDTPAGVVTLFNLHFASPRDALQEVGQARWQGAAALRANSELRWRQSENLAREAAEVSGPVLLAGDFNTPPESAIFRRLWGPYTDAFASAGWGWGYTFFTGKAGVRIDHILTGPGWRCERCWVGPDLGVSPHRPVLADLTWPAPAGR